MQKRRRTRGPPRFYRVDEAPRREDFAHGYEGLLVAVQAGVHERFVLGAARVCADGVGAFDAVLKSKDELFAVAVHALAAFKMHLHLLIERVHRKVRFRRRARPHAWSLGVAVILRALSMRGDLLRRE